MRDKNAWGKGPWLDEPDRLEFRAHGLACLLRRAPNMGAWCGYVAVPPGHPWHGEGYDDVPAEVHGGLTFAKKCDGDKTNGICHVPKPGESDDVWWLGFDCGHAGDLSPGLNSSGIRSNPVVMLHEMIGGEMELGDGEHYWTIDEARAETERLAEQVAKITP